MADSVYLRKEKGVPTTIGCVGVMRLTKLKPVRVCSLKQVGEPRQDAEHVLADDVHGGG